ncbi:lytic murein transglycosylase [Sphingosinicella sp.]|uniref:lytic murein transglycosylase n=1 Tax=Sphingosinicella sp. TaxID=1917971 RepID=UPI004037C074
MRMFRFVLAGLSLALAAPATAQTGLSQAGFEAYLPVLRGEALRAGVRPDTIDRVFPTLSFSARAVALDRQQPGGGPNRPSPPYAPYRARHITQALIDRGRARYAANYGQLQAISRRTGVPPAIMIAIWGKETGYGSIMGNFDLLNALASLSYEGRRRSLFTGEFVATLRMLERGFSRSTLVGSWAGATGHPQFLPSVYIHLAVDGDGDGRADIWRSHLDGLASIANYLRNSGWQPGIPWGVTAQVPLSLDRGAIANRVPAARCAPVFARHSRMMTIRDWRRMGVMPFGAIPDDTMASLIEPDGPGRTAYLATQNYRAILDYNCSNFYALTIGLLANAIGR